MDHNRARYRSIRFVFVGGLFAALAMASLGCQQRERPGGEVSAEVRPGGEGAAVEPGPGAQPAAAEPIRDVIIIVTAQDRTSLFQRPVDVVGAEVQKVSNERVFWIGPSAEQSVPVVLSDDARSSLEQRKQKIQKGDRVAIAGEIHKTPSMQDMEQQWSLSSTDAEQLGKGILYLQARRILIGAPQPGTEAAPTEK